MTRRNYFRAVWSENSSENRLTLLFEGITVRQTSSSHAAAYFLPFIHEHELFPVRLILLWNPKSNFRSNHGSQAMVGYHGFYFLKRKYQL